MEQVNNSIGNSMGGRKTKFRKLILLFFIVFAVVFVVSFVYIPSDVRKIHDEYVACNFSNDYWESLSGEEQLEYLKYYKPELYKILLGIHITQGPTYTTVIQNGTTIGTFTYYD